MNTNNNKALPAEVGEANFSAEVLECKQPVLVEFWAPWSQPCAVVGSVLEEVAEALGGSVKVVKVNADDNPDLSMWYEVQAIPTLLYFVDGLLCTKIVGTVSKQAILTKLAPFRTNP